MTSLRPVTFALTSAALIAASGCRTAGVGNLSRQQDTLPRRADETAAELLVGHNRNAEKVQSLEADTTVFGENRRKVLPGISGKLALERPHNFRLVLRSPMQDVGDIGSNDQEFWFWFKDSPDKALYFCDYDETGASPLAAGIQPDLIVEAMGLRVVPDDEAARAKVSPGSEPGTLVISQRLKTPRGESFFKEMVLSSSTRRLKEQRVYAADHKTLLAVASVTSSYEDYPAPSESGESGETVYLPSRLLLNLPQEKIKLNVDMKGVKLNQRLDPARRQALFTEPKFKNIARVNLAERLGAAPSEPTTVRETMPAPPPRVRLTEPSPLGLDGTRRTRLDPPPLAADLPPPIPADIEAVVGPPLPTADPQPQAYQARMGARTPFQNAVER